MGKSSLCPGFRFHPTDVELVMYYLKKKLLGKKLSPEVIAEVNIYDFSPWDLPAKSNLRNGDLEWFFFCSKSKKYSSGSRMNRATETGYWKATGKDRAVNYKDKTVAKIKTLVFHLDHPPKGRRTNWVMHEYRMEDRDLANAGVVQEAYVLCRLFEKSGAGPRNGAQYGAPFEEEDWDADEVDCSESPAAVGLSGVTETVNANASSSAVMNMTATEPGPSTVTSENERHEETSIVTSSALVDLSGATKALNPRPISAYVMNMKSTEAGPSTITSSENWRHEETSIVMSATKVLNPRPISSYVTNMKSTKAGPSTITSSENERHEETSIVMSSALVDLSGATKVLNPRPISSYVTNMKSTKAGPSTITSSENERHEETSIVMSSALVGLSGATTALNPRPSSSYVMNMKSTEAGPSTITSSENERHVDVPANDDAMLTHEDIDSILHTNNTQEVEDHKGKKVMTKEDDGIFKELAALSNLDAFNMFRVDESADYLVDTFPADDLDVDLGKFFVG